MPEMFRETEPVARKRHQCDLCREEIPKGEKHVARHGKSDDNEIYTFRMHVECEAATKDWDEYDWDYTDEFRRPAPPAAGGGSPSPRSER